MSGQNTGSCEVRSVGWWPNAKQNSRGDMSGHLTRMRGVVTACPAGIWVACGVGSREEWEKAERGGSVPTQLHKNLLSSTLDLASWGLALLPHSSTRQVPRSGCCLNLVCPDIMMNRADRRQRQLHSLHFASECHRALPLKEQARLGSHHSGAHLLLLQASPSILSAPRSHRAYPHYLFISLATHLKTTLAHGD